MKNTTIFKKILAGMLSATLSITAFTLPASAAWKTTENGKQWIQSDGTAAKSKWLTTKSGAKYYIKSNGYMATGMLTLKSKGVTNRYYFNDGGVMQTGWQYINKKYYYFDTKTGAAYTGKQKIGDYTYNFDTKGVWDGKVYNGNKDVTSKVDISKLTGITPKTQSTSNAKTVIIAGEEYSTSLKELLINKEGVTDKDLENLKYMTNLRRLDIKPGSTEAFDYSLYDITEVKLISYDDSLTKWGVPMYTYEYTASVRDTSIAITNLNFCAYMPKLTDITVAYANKLTNITGLSKLKNLANVYFFNCTALKDLHALDNTKIDDSWICNGICVVFTDNVKFAFTDFYFGGRIIMPNACVILRSASGRYQGNCEYLLETDEDYAKNLSGIVPYTKYIQYYNGKLSKDTIYGTKI